MADNQQAVLILVGPTAVGKTDLALHLAQALQGEIISADSRQLYKYMDIGTAKPSPEQRARVPHYLIDVILPDEYYSAGEYSRQGRKIISALLAGGKVPLVVGGSGLYIRALVDGFFDPVVYDPGVRQVLRRRLAVEGPHKLHEQLAAVDPEAALRIHRRDSQRIVRALEVFEITRQPLSALQRQSRKLRASFRPVFVGLKMAREELYRRIERRVDGMIQKGLVEEVRDLLAMGYDRSLNAMQTVGYKEISAFLAEEIDFDEAQRLVKQNSRRYAKRQMTWFSKDRRVTWFELKEGEETSPVLKRVIERYHDEGGRDRGPFSPSERIFP